jgi:hypothetical protein
MLLGYLEKHQNRALMLSSVPFIEKNHIRVFSSIVLNYVPLIYDRETGYVYFLTIFSNFTLYVGGLHLVMGLKLFNCDSLKMKSN